MSEDIQTENILDTLNSSLDSKFGELYRRVLRAPPEFSMLVIHSAVINIVDILEQNGSEYFNREKAKRFYNNFFTKQYHSYKARESTRLRRV